MSNVHYNSALMPYSASLLPFFFMAVSIATERIEINRNIPTQKFEDIATYHPQEIDKVFHSLPNRSIEIEETSQIVILHEFLTKMVTDSKDLEGEIVNMVNRKFEKLLLKL